MIRAWSPESWSDSEAAQAEIQERLDAAGDLTLPILLIRGRMSDVVSENNAREFLSVVPHAEYVDLDLQAWLGTARPAIFDLDIVLPDMLYSKAIARDSLND